MRKLAAISLLVLFLFNLFGYRAWFYFVQQQADARLQVALDHSDYNDADLITVKVPLSMPYQVSSTSFERIDGEVNVNGKIFRYVKRRILDGELVLLCLPDHTKMQLQSAKDDFFKYTNDLQQNSSSKKSGTNTCAFKNALGDYDKNQESSGSYVLRMPTRYDISKNESLFRSPVLSAPKQPPEAV